VNSLKCSNAAGNCARTVRASLRSMRLDVVALERIDEALGHAVALRAAHAACSPRVRPSDLAIVPGSRARCRRRRCRTGTEGDGPQARPPRRRSASPRPAMSISRTGSPGSPLPSHARNAMISRSQQSLANVGGHSLTRVALDSPKPSEHQRVSLAWTETVRVRAARLRASRRLRQPARRCRPSPGTRAWVHTPVHPEPARLRFDPARRRAE